MVKARKDINLKSRKEITLGDFLGVDFSSSPYKVSARRASDMKNLINEYGVNRKRHGWTQLTREYGRINGIFKYSQRDKDVLLVHAKDKIYYMDYGTDSVGYKRYIGEIADKRSQAFYNAGRLYIVTGEEFLVYGSWNGGESYELRPVYNDEDTYIPTTTVNINHDGYTEPNADNDNELTPVDNSAVLDEPNRLSSKRKNQLVGKVPDKNDDGTMTYSATWTLDGEIDINEECFIELEVYGQDKVLKTVEIKSEAGTGNLFLSDGTACGKAEGNKLTLTIDTTPPAENSANITVSFSVTGINENEYKIVTTGSFGVIFGTDGASDRLFIGGNAVAPNIDVFSEMGDFTYFPYRNECVVGTDAAGITGYSRLSDGTLAIFKEEYPNEPGIFYRTGTLHTEYDSKGVITDMYGLFPSIAGVIGETLISRHALANFGGDPLMLSKNGVYGIVLGTNAATDERYTRERSRAINEKLTKHDLSDAVGIVYKDKYYLSVDGACYVADARFTYRTENTLDGAYNYEWWYWDNIPARVFAVIDNKLWFGTEDGRLCAFGDEYTDCTYEETLPNQIGYSSHENRLVFEQGLINAADSIISRDSFWCLLHKECEVINGKIIIPGSKTALNGETLEVPVINGFYEGTEVYATSVGASGLISGEKYFISEVSRGGMIYTDESGVEYIADCYSLTKEGESEPVYLAKGGFSLHRNLIGKELYVTDLKEKAEADADDESEEKQLELTFKLREFEEDTENTLILSPTVRDDNGTPVYTELHYDLTFVYTKIINKQNVVSEWYSPILDMGTNAYSKTLLKITVSTEPEVNGNISFGYETKEVSKSVGAKGINVFSFDRFSFENFSFNTGFASSYSVRVRERNFNYIIFRFVSDSNTDCAVNDFTVSYKINKSNIGVR